LKQLVKCQGNQQRYGNLLIVGYEMICRYAALSAFRLW